MQEPGADSGEGQVEEPADRAEPTPSSSELLSKSEQGFHRVMDRLAHLIAEGKVQSEWPGMGEDGGEDGDENP